jgi:hypothetical protein
MLFPENDLLIAWYPSCSLQTDLPSGSYSMINLTKRSAITSHKASTSTMWEMFNLYEILLLISWSLDHPRNLQSVDGTSLSYLATFFKRAFFIFATVQKHGVKLYGLSWSMVIYSMLCTSHTKPLFDDEE